MKPIHPLRICVANTQPIQPKAAYVLYWMTSQRRLTYNFALEHAVFCAKKLQLPLLIFEAMRCDHKWASRRQLRFVIEGMRDNALICKQHDITYYPYIETEKYPGKGLLESLSQHAALVVGDLFPCFFLPRMLKAAAQKIPIRTEWIDGNGILPLKLAQKPFLTAYHFRRHFQQHVLPFLQKSAWPEPNVLDNAILRNAPVPDAILNRWPMLDDKLRALDDTALAALPVDQNVHDKETRYILPGGPEAALCRLKAFIQNGLAQYKQYRSHPDKKEASSHLSSYLHHGHVSVHQVVEMICQQAQWNAALLSQKATGARQGFWNIDENSESFFDELIVWRELAYHTAFYASEMYDKYESLPDWAQTTLSDHTKDLRSHIYTQAEFESAKTHDELWNAAQNQLLREGRIHNYLRMLWGKKILEWSATPQMALNTMVELNNKYALDGCNPNSYAGIFWTLGRYDRPWPNRPIYGTVRCMSSENTRKKVEVRQYLLRYSANCAKEI